MFGLPASSASFFLRDQAPAAKRRYRSRRGRSLPDAAVSGGARRKTILAENRYAFSERFQQKGKSPPFIQGNRGAGAQRPDGRNHAEGYCMLSISTNSTPGIAENIW
nr:hypothetical protein [Bacillaceae bacterium]